jgi:hypothetical protein
VDDEFVEEASGFLLTVGFLVSSPEVMEARSGSASEVVVDLEANAVRLAAVPATGRVGGLLRLEAEFPERIVEVESGFDAPAVVLVDAETDDAAPAAGRRAPTVAVPEESVAVGLRGGMASLEEDVEAILRRVAEGDEEDGIDDVVVFVASELGVGDGG